MNGLHEETFDPLVKSNMRIICNMCMKISQGPMNPEVYHKCLLTKQPIGFLISLLEQADFQMFNQEALYEVGGLSKMKENL